MSAKMSIDVLTRVFYVVIHGREPGIYDHWDDARAQVTRFKHADYKRHYTLESALAHWDAKCPGHDAPLHFRSPEPELEPLGGLLLYVDSNDGHLACLIEADDAREIVRRFGGFVSSESLRRKGGM